MKPILFVILCLGLCAGLSFVNLSTTTSGADERFSGRVNLALRQAGHQLLKLVPGEVNILFLISDMLKFANYVSGMFLHNKVLGQKTLILTATCNPWKTNLNLEYGPS
ncbi:MAG: hypothetical protein H6557_13340 [Lewinellaceae bacterium]|nr:hypothetical protein [Phaeodactylibacter sp.]MCB9037591.1 hypothetical protein [Lewinellaceae bacterium]